ncbi:MAG: hypothetical protein AB9915_00570 [Candidatus Dojkabacteria bacterium]
MKRFLTISFFVIVLTGAIYFKLTNSYNLDEDLIDTTRAISSFIFGVLFAYYLGSSKDKHKLIVSNLRKDDAQMISMYQQVKYFDEVTRTEIVRLIDNYIQSQIDYFLKDYYLTNKEFMQLYTYIQGIEAKNERELEAKKKLFSFLSDSLEIRKNVEANAYNKITSGEWITLFVFALIILLTTIGLYNGTIESIVVTVLLSFGIIILLVLLDRIDNLKWRQDEYIWIPLTLLFRELDLLPYFPKKIMKNRRVGNIKGKVRIVEYPNVYPDFTDKKIEIVEIK